MSSAPIGSLPWHRPTRAVVDLDAIAYNVQSLRTAAGGAAVCAVVKADAYGHGAVAVARAAIAGGADWLAVALVEEGVALRRAGLLDVPILVLSQPPAGSAVDVVANDLVPTVYSVAAVQELAAAVATTDRPCAVHLKVDTGMHRVGAAPVDSVLVARAVHEAGLGLGGTFTHLAVADELDNPYTGEQLARFDDVLDALRADGIDPGLVHAANSAGTIAHPAARHDMVRVGISLYGLRPDATLDTDAFGCPLQPVLRLESRVSWVKTLPAAARVSYGLRYRLEQESVLATVPIGYADGVPRRLSSVGGSVLIAGRRCPIAGRITMDQLLVDCGPPGSSAAADVAVGDEVVLLGSQGSETIGAWEWATALDTIAYEITCGISARVPRIHVGGEHGG